MKKFKILYLVVLINLLLNSCGSLSNSKKNNSEEFLIEKKSPLSMPPDFEKLPEPKASENSKIQDEENNFESLIKDIKNNNDQTSSVESSSSLEESVIEKIKNN